MTLIGLFGQYQLTASDKNICEWCFCGCKWAKNLVHSGYKSLRVLIYGINNFKRELQGAPNRSKVIFLSSTRIKIYEFQRREANQIRYSFLEIHLLDTITKAGRNFNSICLIIATICELEIIYVGMQNNNKKELWKNKQQSIYDIICCCCGGGTWPST